MLAAIVKPAIFTNVSSYVGGGGGGVTETLLDTW